MTYRTASFAARFTTLILPLLVLGCGAKVSPALLLPGVAEQEPRWRTISLGDSRLVAREPRAVPSLSELAEAASRKAVKEVGNGLVREDEVWTTIIDLRDPADPRRGAFQGDMAIYPASVVKLCYLVTAFDQMATGRLKRDPVLMADLRVMITESDNKATNAVLDRISNTSFGPNLEPAALESFQWKRGTVSRHMQALDLKALWAANKTYSGDIPLYGRDVQALGKRAGDNFEGSNMMSTDDTATLLYLLWRRAVVSPDACDEMLGFMKRDADSTTHFSDIVPPGVTLFSKDGVASPARHDAAIFDLPEGGAIIVVSFSKVRIPESATERRSAPVIEAVAAHVLAELRGTSGELDEATRDEIPGASIKK
jgi:hypothetical protein